MFNLDSILDATESKINGLGNGGGQKIISENHNLGDINWITGMTDPGEMIGCGMYQQLRRLAGETDQAYAARLKVELLTLPAADRAKIETVLAGAAIKRAGLDTSNGRVNVMVAGAEALKAHWHGLGVSFYETVDSKLAEQKSGTDFTVSKVQNYHRLPDGTEVESKGSFALVRTDTWKMLTSHVGGKYRVIQNSDAFAFLDELVGEFGARYETAGSLFGGQKVWMQITLPRQAFEVVPGDAVSPTAVFTNNHDGSGLAWCWATERRIVCNNTRRIAMQGCEKKGIGLRHTGDIKQRVREARKAMGLAVQGFEKSKVEAQTLVQTPVESQEFFRGVLDAVLDVTDAQVRAGLGAYAAGKGLDLVLATTEAKRTVELEYNRAVKRRTSVLDDILERYESERCGISGIRGSAWAAFNAISESVDHGKLGQPGRRVGTQNEQDSRAFESVIAGERDDMKQAAYAQALALAAN